MKILVIGLKGQIARSLLERGRGSTTISILAAGRPQLDLARPDTVWSVIRDANPDIVVSAAAYTAVDHAEAEPELCARVNVAGAEAVAAAASRLGVPVIHLSTDYVFSGEAERPYVEDDEPGPLNVYGRTKLASEIAVAAVNSRHVIVRTSWLYSPFGQNFVKTMLRLAAERDEIPVVADQEGNPTSALDVASGLITIAEKVCADRTDALSGTYHLAGRGATTWYGLARHVMATSRDLGGAWAEIRAIEAKDYPVKAMRPRNSRLTTGKLEAAFAWTPADWQNSVRTVIARLLAVQAE